MARARNSLSTYRAKRDFRRTAEPSDDGRVAKSEHLRFVIQKHDATRLHYDLRLEIGDVFHSWAVTRGPSLDPTEKRLAVAVEHHPLAYGDFEGTIPDGEYGGGTVMIWDRGFWSPTSDTTPLRSLDQGQLKFILAGEKLRGGFVLVGLPTRPGETQKNWLLIKHKDQWATPGKDTVQRQARSVASGRTMAEIAAGKSKAPTSFMTTRRAQRRDGTSNNRSLGRRRRAAAVLSLPKLTNGDRTLWPGDPALTKRDLADYLVSVAPWMSSHLAGRPCSFLRAPSGITGEQFFQRHPMPGQPEKLGQTRFDDAHEPYMRIDDAQTLIDLAQFSVIEFHPWNCAPMEPRIPGRLVFDLDPAPDVSFVTVIEAAREVRTVLEKLGLVAFCKTTGGKGLHVVTPLTTDRSISWDQAKLFAQTIASQLANTAPDRYVATMSKTKRTGRIFIDYLRNEATATAVAPLSTRARPGAPVSMPLDWRQLRRGLAPNRFTIKTAPEQLAKLDPWRDYETAARPLAAAISALVSQNADRA